jgi:hypothetical protein
MDCLGFVEGMACPHYQEEKDRRPSVHEMLKKGTCMPGYAIDGGAAVHIVNGKYHKSLQFYPDSHVYQVSYKDNMVEEQKMKMVEL